MCGTIKTAENADEAVQFALAYGAERGWADDPEEEQVARKRLGAEDFLDYYVPAYMRREARNRLAKVTSDDLLNPKLVFNRDVVEY